MLKLYARLAGKSIRLALRGWPAALLLPIYARLLVVAAASAGQNMPRQFLVSIGAAFLISSYLHLVSLAVAGRKIGLSDLRDSFLAHVLDVISVMFATWLIQWAVAGAVEGYGDRGVIIAILVDLTMVVFFNAVPELIYLGGGQSRWFGLLVESARFISAHWLEWLAPSALVAAAVLAPSGLIQQGPLALRLLVFQQLFSLQGLTQTILGFPKLLIPFVSLFMTWALVFRGLLFGELASRVRRPRSWR